jgi:hypothetical protein
MSRYWRFYVDYENNSEEFWGGQGRQAWGKWAGPEGPDDVILPEHLGKTCLNDLMACPGWTGGDERAPSPILIDEDFAEDVEPR